MNKFQRTHEFTRSIDESGQAGSDALTELSAAEREGVAGGRLAPIGFGVYASQQPDGPPIVVCGKPGVGFRPVVFAV